MNTLCLTTNLTSAELAAWVQAIGSIVAIIAVVLIAVWQANKQHRSALALLHIPLKSATCSRVFRPPIPE